MPVRLLTMIRMIFRSCCLASLLLATVPVQARLGETDVKLLERYGSALQYSSHALVAQGRSVKLGTTIVFKHEDWDITGDLVGDRCARLRYTKRGKWSEADIAGLLEVNRQEEPWTEISANPKVRREWTRPDGSTARWSKNGMNLTAASYHAAKAKAKGNAKMARP